jgi:hypothetical protein
MAMFRAAPNNQTPWYKSCAAQAAGSFLAHGTIDALGVIPGEGAIAAGFYGGKVAFQAVQFGTGLASSAYGLQDTTRNGKVGSGLGATGIVVGLAGKSGAGLAKGVAELIPGIGQRVAVASVLWDG